jgi:hypothetical protein
MVSGYGATDSGEVSLFPASSSSACPRLPLSPRTRTHAPKPATSRTHKHARNTHHTDYRAWWRRKWGT